MLPSLIILGHARLCSLPLRQGLDIDMSKNHGPVAGLTEILIQELVTCHQPLPYETVQCPTI